MLAAPSICIAAVTAWAPSPNATTHGRSLISHEFLRSGSFCMGGNLAPVAYLLGCQRCGTNSLFEDIIGSIKGARRGHALHGEPDFYEREQHFFAKGSQTDSWGQGVTHYVQHFPECPSPHGNYQFVIDATPAYLRKPIVADRMHEVLPGAALPKLKFVVILRDPAHRLYAYWDAFVNKGTGANNFDRWLEVTMKSVHECQKKHGTDLWPPPDTNACDDDTIEGVAAGLYAHQLNYWFKKFDPKQFLVTSTTAYEEDTQKVVKDVSEFLTGTSALDAPARHPSNIDSIKVFEFMGHEARSKLGTFYQPHNSQLLHVLNTEQKLTCSPSVRGLGIQLWSS